MPLLQAEIDLGDPRADQISDHDLRRIWSWNAEISPAVDACVHDLLKQNFQLEAQAICSWDGELTYRELDSLSSRLADELMRLNIRPESIVPLCFEKSLWMPVAMLAVMKAGGASCGVDTTQPEARLQAIMDQIQPQVVLCSASQLNLAKKFSKNDTIIMVVDKDNLEQLPCITDLPFVPPIVVRPNNMLYLVFTSGSTGMPKGVVITHSNFSSALAYQTSRLGFRRTSRVLDFASYAFDAAWYNTLHTFYAGGCLCIPSENDRRNDLTGCISRLRPNFANLTPKLCEFLDTPSLQALDMIELAGEAPDERQVGRMRTVTKVRFAYGPAECSILSTVTDEHAVSSRIGNGLGVRTWVVNADNPDALSPIGSVGELWIEGPLVGRCYLNNPEKTAAAFVNSPAWLLQGASGFEGRSGRLYRTGDLVRYAADGSLLFVGRKDGQVKIRGQRVELGEIEHHIRQSLPENTSYSVVAEVISPLKSDNAILVAFIENVDSMEAVMTTLEAKLAELLPSYMVPTAYISVDRIPVSQTGKTDRQQLRRLGATYTLERLAALNLARTKGRPPKTAIERLLQRLWSSALKINPNTINAEDSFLKIGGDSIGIMRLVAAAREEGLLLSVGDVFKYPRLCELANIVRKIPLEDVTGEVIPPFSLLDGQDRTTIRKSVAHICGIEASQVEDVFPCTPLQQGLLALSARRADQYVVRSVHELQPSVQLSQFRAAWETVVSKSPILRTCIVDLDDQGLMQVVTNIPIEWCLDANTTYNETSQSNVMGLGTPLARFALQTSPNGERLFTLTMHHAICDGYTVPLLCHMAEKAYCEQTVPPSPPFQAFVRHIQQLDQADAAIKWRKYLEGTEAQVFPRVSQAAQQPKANTEMMHSVSSFRWPRTGVTRSNIVRAAWSILVAQYTATNDVVFGATVSGRQAPVPMVEQMTGPTIATTPVRVVLDWEEDIGQLLKRVQEQAVEMAAVEQMGLQWIRRVCDDAEKACQFQTLLVIQPPENETDRKSSLFTPTTDKNWKLEAFNPYALLLECNLEDEGIQFRISFDSTILDKQQANRMMQQLEQILRQLCTPEAGAKKLLTMDIISEQDSNDIWRYNRNVPAAVEGFVQELILETIREQPSAPAICAWDGDFTYEELHRHSTRLANVLLQHGVGPAMIVPVCLEKSKWAPVAMLAVLKAGGAFSMLPPSLPSGRRESMISVIQPMVVITSTQYAHYFPNVATIFPEEYENVSGFDNSKYWALAQKVTPSTLAAVLFTSGTTGNPKGIMLDHRCLSTTAQYMARKFNVGTHSRVFQYASYSFDVSIHETMMVLSSGGCICIPSEEDRHNDLAGAVLRLEANWASLSPSVARTINPESVSTLETLVFAGEALTDRDVLPWVDKLTLFNWYGPAEYSLSATSLVQLSDWVTGTLGFGSASTCWVVRPENRDALAPIGAIGELVVEGPGLMMGYLHDTERTNAVVMTNSSWLNRGALCSPGRRGRLYQTGDLVKYNADGSLIYIGRKDAQVKIRGQRVELEEVEHHLVQQLYTMGATGSQAVVEVVTPVASASPKLAAFVKGGGSQSQLNELEKRLACVLPSYMIPSLYISISDIPITANGKTDRKRLRAMGGSLTREQVASSRHTPGKQLHIPARTIIEKKLQELWISILGLDSIVSIEDHFFEVGGDSIAAMRLVTAARQHGLSFTVADIFNRPLLGDLASIARPVMTAASNVAPRPFSLLDHNAQTFVRTKLAHMTSVSDVFPVTRWQSTCIDLALASPPRLLDYFSIDLPSDSSLEEVTRGCSDLWRKMDILRTIFIPWREQYLQLVPEQSNLPVQYRSADEGDIEYLTEKICKNDIQQPLVLFAPFTRFYIVSGSNGAMRLIIRLSHAQYDGTSLLNFMQCLRASFNKEQLPDKTPFTAFIQHTRNNQLAAIKYWRLLLEGSSFTSIAANRIISDFSKPLVPIVVGRLVELLPCNDSFTPATTFTAACAHFLSQLTGSSDVTFGRLVSGRAMLPVQLRNVAGPCVNIIPVRVHDTQSLEQTRQSVHEQLIDSLPFDTLGAKEVIENCTSWSRETRSFGFVTSYQDLGDAEEEIKGVSCRLRCLEDIRPGTRMMEDEAVMIFAKPSGDYLQIIVNADGRLYAEQMVRRWCDMLAASIENFRLLGPSH